MGYLIFLVWFMVSIIAHHNAGDGKQLVTIITIFAGIYLAQWWETEVRGKK